MFTGCSQKNNSLVSKFSQKNNIPHALLHTQYIARVYTTQWIFIILRKFTHKTVTSPNQKWMRVADTVKPFWLFLLLRGEFYFDVVDNFEPKKITPNCNALIKLFLALESLKSIFFSWQCKTMLFTNKKAYSDVIRACT